MRLDGRRESRNVKDIRGKGGKAAGMGLGGLVLVCAITWLLGGNPLDVVRQAGGLEILTGGGEQTEYVPTAEEEALAKFSLKICFSSCTPCTYLFSIVYFTINYI